MVADSNPARTLGKSDWSIRVLRIMRHYIRTLRMRSRYRLRGRVILSDILKDFGLR